jgi:hypothetical protein
MVVGVAGHQDIPESAAQFIETGIVQLLRRLGGEFTGASSLAAGADQLFAQVVQRLGGHLHVVIPSDGYETTFVDAGALGLFKLLLQKADTVETLNHTHPSDEAFLDAGRRIVDLSQVLVAVWDGLGARGVGGTADIVQYANKKGIEVVNVWPSGTDR